jgi:putative flavoprotein involved in K+ transport
LRQLESKEAAMKTEQFETVVIGGGQAGLSVGYHLAQLDRPFVILDERERIGDNWRQRWWQSLRLFSPARYDGLPGWGFPAAPWSFPTRDEMADYLEAYARRFELPVRTGTHVETVTRVGDRYRVGAREVQFEAENVVVASGYHRQPVTPGFAEDLSTQILQLHASEYRDPSQLEDGDVLVVGAGNSGADISLELAAERHVWLSGPDKGHIPANIESRGARLVFPVLWFLWSHVLTVRTPIGRYVRPKVLASGAPLIRVKPKHLAAAGVERVPRTVGVRDGLPELEDSRVLDVANVIWCTGFRPDLGWIDLPALRGKNDPETERGVFPGEPGLYVVGLDFLYAFNSENVGGVGRDAGHIARHIDSRAREGAGKRSEVPGPAMPALRRAS